MRVMEVLEDIRSRALTESEKGRKFELLMQAWLKADPVFASELADVWLWEEFPEKEQFGSRDLGIDLVARTTMDEYWAIQCKFYARETRISKADVDSFVAASGRTFVNPATGQRQSFAARYWISTNDYFNENAEEISHNQRIDFQRLTLQSMHEAAVDWEALYKGTESRLKPKTPEKHQKTAVKKARAHFARADRGKLIMACGTGKSYTANLIANDLVKKGGSILCLVPSISLVNQFLNSWMADTKTPARPICVCSDAKASRKRGDDQGESARDLILPATTDADEIARRFIAHKNELEKAGGGHLVIFSTYQSLDAVAKAQEKISEKMGIAQSFDLIICDEAHRTTGIVKADEGRSPFTKIHDNNFIRGEKRLYMTATPRVYADNAKIKARQSDIELCSMDDEALYGREIHNVSFGYAVDNGLLTDYKVLVLTVGSENQLPRELRDEIANPDKSELNFDAASRLVGCVNGLAKNTTLADNAMVWEMDPRVMKRAIVFCPNIDKKNDPSSSKNTAEKLPSVAAALFAAADSSHRGVKIDAEHIDGSMDSGERARLLGWLAEGGAAEDECRVLCNVRCLSEGIDVPALDAAIFLSPRSSQIDVVQSVGRVMRNFRRGHSDEKRYGYIIVPVVVNPNVPPENALNDNQSFAVVWSILNALRSHDDRFEAMINSIALNREKPKNVVVDRAPFFGEGAPGDLEEIALLERTRFFDSLEKGIYVKMVEKVGSRLYWERWARNIAPVAANLIGRIAELIAVPGETRETFLAFLESLRAAINDSIDEKQAIEMLGQHMITRPVFEALFKDYAFDENNAVTRAMKIMVDRLLAHGLDKDAVILDDFYQSVRRNLGEVKTLSGKQIVIKNLYDSFFRGAFPLAVERLGIVYTPVECVDFIIRSVDAALRREFGIGLTDCGVHILDPFAGTGTFIVRLLQSGLIRREDLERKYRKEIHCNEIMLLPYYVADVNIESVYHDLTNSREYSRFDGICLSDTFAIDGADGDPSLYPFLQGNFEAVEAEKKAPIRVIIGNPPYSAGQKSGNDNAQNLKYPELDRRIEQTYVANETGVNKRNLYDSYIRAFRWASDRIRQSGEGGVIGFIANGGWLDGNAAAGFRKCLEREFSSVYIFHLRGDQRTSGELSRKEGGKIFGSGSRAPVVIAILVYNPAHEGKAKIYYSDIGDYLNREDKLKIISERANIYDKNMAWREIEPDEHGDWLKQRSDLFSGFLPLGDKKDKENKDVFFKPIYALGLNTNRDAWVYNFSKKELKHNVIRAIDFYNEQCERINEGEELCLDPRLFSWTDPVREKATKGIHFSFAAGEIVSSMYRPFCQKFLYFSTEMNHRPGQWPRLFPTPDSENLVICIESPGGKKPFSCLITDKISDLHIMEATQCFPLYYYREKENLQASFLERGESFEKRYAITDRILRLIRARYGDAKNIGKDRIFYYVYGLLHSPDYRARFNDDLKKQLPRVPIPERVEDFVAFADAGHKLADLHLHYENLQPYPGVEVEGGGSFRVEKMKFGGKQGAWDKGRIIYNSRIEITGIPIRAYEYIVNGRSAIEWIMESYRLKTDKDSGIVNDPNAWAEETGEPDYILKLLLSVITLSMKTLDIVEKLPRLDFGEKEGEDD